MALSKSLDTPYGVQATYWNIGAKQEDFKTGGIEVVLYGWLDESARRTGKQPLGALKVQYTGLEYTPDISRADLYTKLKEQEQFADSKDV